MSLGAGLLGKRRWERNVEAGTLDCNSRICNFKFGIFKADCKIWFCKVWEWLLCVSVQTSFRPMTYCSPLGGRSKESLFPFPFLGLVMTSVDNWAGLVWVLGHLISCSSSELCLPRALLIGGECLVHEPTFTGKRVRARMNSHLESPLESLVMQRVWLN